MIFDVDRRRTQVPEAEQAIMAYHRQTRGDGPYTATGRVNRGC